MLVVKNDCISNSKQTLFIQNNSNPNILPVCHLVLSACSLKGWQIRISLLISNAGQSNIIVHIMSCLQDSPSELTDITREKSTWNWECICFHSVGRRSTTFLLKNSPVEFTSFRSGSITHRLIFIYHYPHNSFQPCQFFLDIIELLKACT